MIAFVRIKLIGITRKHKVEFSLLDNFPARNGYANDPRVKNDR